MKTHSIFIDGANGTTGLRIHQRLGSAPDIELVTLPEAQRKSLPARIEAAAAADVCVLCLPDDAAREMAAALPPTTRIVDASTAHRTQPGWVYGFAELHDNRQKIQQASRVAVPGCHASGYIALAAPLVQAGAVPADAQLSCTSVTGYSGGGKQMIAAYEDKDAPTAYTAPRAYAVGMQHKHLPEMAAATGLARPPLFTPIVANFYSGMLVTLPLHTGVLAPRYRSVAALGEALATYYAGSALVRVHPPGALPPDGTLAANTLAGKDSMELFVLGTDDTPLLAARYDNLGKGASGAAIQCLNLMLGRGETTGLVL